MKRRSVMLVVSLMFVVLGALASEAAVYKMKIHSVGSDMHASTFALKDFKKYVEEKSKEQIQVRRDSRFRAKPAWSTPKIGRAHV